MLQNASQPDSVGRASRELFPRLEGLQPVNMVKAVSGLASLVGFVLILKSQESRMKSPYCQNGHSVYRKTFPFTFRPFSDQRIQGVPLF